MKLLQQIKDNLTEIYLGLLLFVGVPTVLAFYLDWRAGVLASILLQSTAIILFWVKGNK